MSIKTQGWPFHADDEIEAVTQVLKSGSTNYWTGTECRDFEKEFAAFIGTPYAIALMNGTIALEAALYALDIGPGDEVITPSRTFFASASCIVMRGATPVIADVDLDSQVMTVATIEACITSHTKAIIVVHLAGWPANMPAIMALAEKYNLKVIEDCAQAHGAMISGKCVGAWGHVAAFSFCQDKIMTTGGEGGMLTTQDKTLWEKIWAYKDHGKNYNKVYHQTHAPGFRWLHDSFGTNWRMTEMQAAIGRIQLQKLPIWLRLREANAEILTSYLKPLNLLRIPQPDKDMRHAFYKYYVFVRPLNLKPNWTRDRLVQAISAADIPVFTGSCSEIYLEQAFVKSDFKVSEQKPNAMELASTSLMFLVHPTLTPIDMQKIAETLVTIFSEASIEPAIVTTLNTSAAPADV